MIPLKFGYQSEASDTSTSAGGVPRASREDIEEAFTISDDGNVRFLIQGETRRVRDAVIGRSRVESRLARALKTNYLIQFFLIAFEPSKRIRRSAWRSSSGKKTPILKNKKLDNGKF